MPAAADQENKKIPLTLEDQEALSYYLIQAASAEDAAKAAQISNQRFDEAYSAVVPALRGYGIRYNRYITGANIVDADPLRLDYEVRLSQLQHQHQMCFDAYRRTDDYAKHRLETYLSKPDSDASAPSVKSIVGDIRFLQLARAIRHEMDQLEVKLKERVELMQSYRARQLERSQQERKKTTDGATPPTSNNASSPPPPPQQNAPQPSVAKPQTPIPQPVTTKPTSLPADAIQRLANADSQAQFLNRHELLEALSPDRIPTIQPPPRKPDKYTQSQTSKAG